MPTPTIDPNTWIDTIIKNFLKMVVWPAFLGAVIIMFIWAGFLFLSSHGEPAKIDQAKKAVLFAVIGVIVAFIAFSAIGLIKKIFGIT